MDELVEFLPQAQWTKRGQHTSICNDKTLESLWPKFASELPDRFKNHELQLWKITGLTKLTATSAYLIPISIIPGTPEPQVVHGPQLVPKSEPFHFSNETIISGSLYCVVAYPPKNPEQSQAN